MARLNVKRPFRPNGAKIFTSAVWPDTFWPKRSIKMKKVLRISMIFGPKVPYDIDRTSISGLLKRSLIFLPARVILVSEKARIIR